MTDNTRYPANPAAANDDVATRGMDYDPGKIEDPKARAFLEKFMALPGTGAPALCMSTYEMLYGPEDDLPPSMKHIRMQFFNSKLYRAEFLIQRGQDPDMSFEDIERYLRKKHLALKAGHKFDE